MMILESLLGQISLFGNKIQNWGFKIILENSGL